MMMIDDDDSDGDDDHDHDHDHDNEVDNLDYLDYNVLTMIIKSIAISVTFMIAHVDHSKEAHA